MSFLIQKPIDFPKHYGQEIKASVLAKKTLDEAKAIIKKAARRKVIIGSNDNDSLFGMGINLDREMNDKIGNTLKRTSKTEIKCPKPIFLFQNLLWKNCCVLSID
jgi:hypothetical protein